MQVDKSLWMADSITLSLEQMFLLHEASTVHIVTLWVPGEVYPQGRNPESGCRFRQGSTVDTATNTRAVVQPTVWHG